MSDAASVIINFPISNFAPIGDGETDDAANIAAAISALSGLGGGVLHFRTATYALGSVVSVLSNVTIDLNGSTIVGTPTTTQTHFFQLAADHARIVNGTLDGTNLDPPATGVDYAYGPSNGVGIYVTKTGAAPVGLRITDVVFKNFPTSAVLAGAGAMVNAVAFDLIVANCRAENCQTYTAHATPSVFELHGCDNSRIIDCNIIGYTLKGYHFGNAAFSQMVRCNANGGVVGHGSHHMTGGNDCVIEGGSHTGTGYGFKFDGSARPTVRGFQCYGGDGVGMFQDCVDFIADAVRAADTTSGMVVQGGTTGPISGEIVNCVLHRTIAGTTLNHYGIDIRSASGALIDGVRVAGNRMSGWYLGVRVANTGFAQTNIDIVDNRITGEVLYGIVANLGSGKISGNVITGSGASTTAGISLASDGVTTSGIIDIDRNQISNCNADQIAIVGTGAQLFARTIRVRGNSTNGGTQFLDLVMRASSDVVQNLVIENNQGDNLSTRGMTLTLGTAATTFVTLNGNDFRGGAGARVTTAAWSNLATFGNVSGNFDYPATPEGAVPAEIGQALCRRTDTGQLYAKTSNTYGATGWTAQA